MKIKSAPLALITLGVFVAGILLSMAFNIWKTESTKTPVKFSEGEFEGMFNPADIRGSYSFEDIAGSFDVSVETLAKAFAVDKEDNPGAFQAKELEEIFQIQDDGGEVGTDALRLFVARYTGLPYEPEDTTRLPAPAISVLKDKLSVADLEALKAISVEVQLLRIEGNVPGSESDEHDETEAAVIKGKTTFGDLLDWGLDKADIEEILGMKMGAAGISVRDFAMEKEIEFGDIKTALQEKLDTVN